MGAGDALAAGFRAVFEFREDGRRQVGAAFFNEILGFGDRELARDFGLTGEGGCGGKIEDFRGVEFDGDFLRGAVGIDAVGAALAVEAERRDDGDDAFVEEELEGLRVHALDLAGVLLVDATEDAGGVGDDGIDVGGAEIDGGKALHDFVGEADRGVDADLQCRHVGDADAVGIRDGDAALGGELLDLMARAVDQDDFDAQGAEHCEVEQEVLQILRAGGFAIDRHDKNAFAEERDILEDFAEVRDVHFYFVPISRWARVHTGKISRLRSAACGR